MKKNAFGLQNMVKKDTQTAGFNEAYMLFGSKNDILKAKMERFFIFMSKTTF